MIDDRGKLRIFVALAVDHVAPMAPDRADIEKDRLVLGLGAGKGLRAPLVPIHRLVHGGAQIGTRGIGQAAFGFFVHGIPSRTLDLRPRGADFLLDRVFRAGILGIDRLAAGKTFILAMIETNAVFSQPPAQIDLFILKNGGKIHQAGVEVFHHAARWREFDRARP